MDSWEDLPVLKEESWDSLPVVPPKKQRPFIDITDTASALGEFARGIPTTTKSSYYQIKEGLDNPWKRSENYLAAGKATQEYQKELDAAEAAAVESGDTSSVSSAFRAAAPSSGFSIGTMASSLAGGSLLGTVGGRVGAAMGGPAGLAAGEIGGRVVGAFGSAYGAAYRAAGAQFLDDARDEINYIAETKFGRPLTEAEQEEAYQELLPLAQAFGNAEAGPEAIGNLAMGAAGRFVLGLGRETVKRLATSALAKAGAVAGGATVELGGETATQVEQKRIEEQKQALLEGRDPAAVAAAQPDRTVAEYATALEEVGPATLATLFLMGGAGKVASKVLDMSRPAPVSLTEEELRASVDLGYAKAKLDEEKANAAEDTGYQSSRAILKAQRVREGYEKVRQTLAEGDIEEAAKLMQAKIVEQSVLATTEEEAAPTETANVEIPGAGTWNSDSGVPLEVAKGIIESKDTKGIQSLIDNGVLTPPQVIPETAPSDAQAFAANAAKAAATGVPVNATVAALRDTSGVEDLGTTEGDVLSLVPKKPVVEEPTTPNEAEIEALVPELFDPALSTGSRSVTPEITEKKDAVARKLESLLGLPSGHLTPMRWNVSKVFKTADGRYLKVGAAADAESLQRLQDQLELAKESPHAVVPELRVLHSAGIYALTQSDAGIEGADLHKSATKEDKQLFELLKEQNPFSAETSNGALRVETDTSLKNMALYVGPDGMVRTRAFDFDGVPEDTSPADVAAAKEVLAKTPLMPGIPLTDFSPAIQNRLAPAEQPVAEEVADPFTPVVETTGKKDLQVEPDTRTEAGMPSTPPQRDTTKPEQMTPGEYASSERDPELPKNYVLSDGNGNFVTEEKNGWFKVWRLTGTHATLAGTVGFKGAEGLAKAKARLKEVSAEMHEEKLQNGIRTKKPVSKAAVDAYGITLPEGYVKQGDLYVFQPQTTAAETQTSGVATERDLSKPEQMTPEEYRAAYKERFGPKGQENVLYEGNTDENLGKAMAWHARNRAMQKAGFDSGQAIQDLDAGVNPTHAAVIRGGFKLKEPVSAEAVGAYGIKLPEGYVRQGDLYIFSPQTKESETETAATEGTVMPGGSAIERDTSKPEQMTPEERRDAKIQVIAVETEKGLKPIYYLAIREGDSIGIYGSNYSETDGELIGSAKPVNLIARPTLEEVRQVGSSAPAYIEKLAIDEGAPIYRANGIGVQAAHQAEIASARLKKAPVSKAAVDAYGITLPEGYAAEGELYVFQPSGKVEEVTETEPPAKPAPQPKPAVEVGTPISDPLGYGTALIALFPSLQKAGVTVIPIEEAMTRLDAEWQKKKDSGKATRLDQIVYEANKRNTQSALDGENIGGIWTRTDKTVAVSNKATPSAMAHEVGHAIMELEYANAPEATKKAIEAEYTEWFKSKYGPEGVPTVADQRRIWEWMTDADWLNPATPFPQEQRVAKWEAYRSGFNEWFADEVAKWAVTRQQPRTLVDKFFSEIAAKLQKLWDSVKSNFSPNETLASWLDSISVVSEAKKAKPAVEVETPVAGVKAPRKPKSPKPVTEQNRAPVQEEEVAVDEAPRPLPPKYKPNVGDLVSGTVNGVPVVGKVTRVSGGGTVTAEYGNGKEFITNNPVPAAQALATAPKYQYTQEQNTAKAARLGLPTTPGVTENAGEVIRNVLLNASKDTRLSPLTRAISRALLSVNFDGVRLRIKADGRSGAGLYTHENGTGEIMVNLRAVARGQVDSIGVFLHEALHHATLEKLFNPAPGIETEAVDAIKKIVDHVKTLAGPDTVFDYELGSPWEFVSALFTRPDFQNYLASVPAPGSPTGIAKFRSALSELFRRLAELVTGQKVQKGSTMEQAIAATMVLFETPQRTGDGAAGAMADRDAEYMAAVEAGDMVTAQALVDQAAKAAGFDVRPMYHGTNRSFTEFDAAKIGKNERRENPLTQGKGMYGDGFYFTRFKGDAANYGSRVLKVFLRLANPMVLSSDDVLESREARQSWESKISDEYKSYLRESGRSPDDAWQVITESWANAKGPMGVEYARRSMARDARKYGFDSIQADLRDGKFGETIVFDPNQIKSADPVTRDDAGNVIPLSQRFNETSNDIRYAASTSAPATSKLSPDKARAILTKRFGKAGDKFVVGAFNADGDIEWDAKIGDGNITLNLKYLDTEAKLIAKAEHELAHAVFDDPAVQQEWKAISRTLSPAAREKLAARLKGLGYADAVLDEEMLVQTLEEIRRNTPPAAWQRFVKAVRDALLRLFGIDVSQGDAERAAARIVAAGEAALAQGLDPAVAAFGQSAAESAASRRHAELEAKFNAGTITPEETAEAQALVDEAASAANYDTSMPLVHHTFRDFTVFKMGGYKQPYSDAGWSGKGVWMEPEKLFLAKKAKGGRPNIAHTHEYESKLAKEKYAETGSRMKTLRLYAKILSPVGIYGASGTDFAQEQRDEYGFSRSFPIIITDKDLEILRVSRKDAAFTADENGNIEEVIVFDPNQIKSADPFTGVPLDRRFDAGSNDIRYSRVPDAEFNEQTNVQFGSEKQRNIRPAAPQQETANKASAIIGEAIAKDPVNGRMNALLRFDSDTKIPLEVRAIGAAMLAEQVEYLNVLSARAGNALPEATDLADDFVDRAISIVQRLGTELGRGLNIFNALARLTPEGFIRRRMRQHAKGVDEVIRQNFTGDLRGDVEKAFSETPDVPEAEAVKKVRGSLPDTLAKKAIERFNALLDGPVPPGQKNPLSELIAKNIKSPVEGFKEKLIELGVDPEIADALDAVSAKLRAEYTEAARLKAIDKLLAVKTRNKTAKEKLSKVIRTVLEAGNLGAMDSQQFMDLFAKEFGLPPMTKEFKAEIKEMVRGINALPKGPARIDAIQALEEKLALWEGIKTRDVLMSTWYANILSGVSTQAIGLLYNNLNLFLKSAVTMLANPKSAKAFVQGALGEGLRTGLKEAVAALQGRGLYKASKWGDKKMIDSLGLLSKQGPRGAAQWAAYLASVGTLTRKVFHVMEAVDALAWNTAREGHAYLAAHRALREELASSNPTAEEFSRKFVEKLGGDTAQIEADLREARDQRIAAGASPDLTTIDRMARQMRDDRRTKAGADLQSSNRFADRVVVQQEPEGIGRLISALITAIQQVNVIGVPVGQMLVPFNKIVSNLFEQSLDYTPVGIVRGALGGHLTDVVQINKDGIKFREGSKIFDSTERWERAITGTLATSIGFALYALAASMKDEDDEDVPFMIYAFGPTDKNKRSQMPKGWAPFTIKIGDVYYKFAEAPFGMMFAGIGSALDAIRYEKMDDKTAVDKLTYVMKSAAKGFMTQGVLSSVDTAIDVLMLKASDKKLSDIPVSAMKGAIPGQGFLRDLSTLTDDRKIDGSTMKAALLRDIPFVKSYAGNPELNRFGEPVTFDGLPVVRRFGTLIEKNHVADYLGRNDLYIPGMPQIIEVGAYLPKEMKDRLQRRALEISAMENGMLTKPQAYAFGKRAGELTKRAVERIMQANPPITNDVQRKKVQNVLNKQIEIARKRAMLEAVPIK